MTDYQRQLSRELKAAGASAKEVRELLPVAASLCTLKHDVSSVKRTYGEKAAWRWRRAIKPTTYMVLGTALGASLLVISQAALPTSWLFPIQIASDNVAMSIHPQYRATVMMKRARQVNQLVADRAGTPAVLATLTDYTRVADAYKSLPDANYAAFEYCESNLLQAAGSASPTVRHAITASLRSLDAL